MARSPGRRAATRIESAADASSSIRRLTEPIRILAGNPRLTRLVLAFAGLTIAEWSYVTALTIYAFRTHGTIAVGLVGFRLFLAAISSFFCIPLVERHPGGRLLTTVAATRTLLVGASCLVAATHGAFAILLLLVAVDAIVAAPYRPAQAALLPTQSRSPQELAATTAAISTVKTLSQALGGVVGGLLLIVTTPQVVFGGASIVFGGAALATMRFLDTAAPITGSRSRRRGVIRDSMAVVRDHHVAVILVVSGLRTFVRGMWLASAVIASLRLLHAGSAGVGLLMLASGVGGLVSVPVSARLIGRTRIGNPAAIALVACGIPLGLIASFPILGIALVLVTTWGVGMAVADVATSSLIYRVLETPMLPRATAAIESSKLACEGLGALLAPVIVTAIGVRWALVVAASPLPLVVALGWNMLHRVDADADERARVLGLLHVVDCFAMLDVAELENLASRVVRRTTSDGEDIVSQGESGDEFFVVEVGSVEVWIDGFIVGLIGAGGGFGEKALLRNVPRTATVKSRGEATLLALSREAFLSAMTGTEELDAPAEAVTMRRHTGQWSRRDRAEALARVSLFSHLDSNALLSLADRSEIASWSSGERFITQGEHGDHFYVILSGRACVVKDGAPVAELRSGDQVGEVALLYDVPRTADVVALEALQTLSLRVEDFDVAVRAAVLRG